MRYKQFVLLIIIVLISCIPKSENNKNKNSKKVSEQNSPKTYSNKDQPKKNQPQKIYLLEQDSDSKEGREERLNIVKTIYKKVLERGANILFLKSDSIENILAYDPDFSGVVLHETEASLQLNDDSGEIEAAPVIGVVLAATVVYVMGIRPISKKNIPDVLKKAGPFSLPRIKKISGTNVEGARKIPSKKYPQAASVKEVKFLKQKLTEYTNLTRVDRIKSPPHTMLGKIDGIEISPGVKNITGTQFNIVEAGKGGQGQVFKISFTDDAGKKWEIAAKNLKIVNLMKGSFDFSSCSRTIQVLLIFIKEQIQKIRSSWNTSNKK